MSENLRYAPSGHLSECYMGYQCGYGRYYTWAGAMDSVRTGCGNGKTCNASGVLQGRGACPVGWHLPDTTELNYLFVNIGGASVAGTKLKASSGWSSGNGTDNYGFSAAPRGYLNWDPSDGNYHDVGDHAYFWTYNESNTQNTATSARAMSLYSGANVNVGSMPKTYLYTVRCLKN